ncbi:hypothetical protein ATI61_114114 [Archangium gephyra]|nr:hypothetical protein [Archangium gephyra]REG24506.1 hypothetical protein ATI61_114114 [Archangium gephyra]
MNRFARRTVATLFLLLASTSCALLPGINNLPGLELPGMGLTSAEDFLKESPPVTTSLSDAVTEVPSLDGFEPETIAPMRELPRGLEGGFLLLPGVWEMDVRSYCLQAGTHAPSSGAGHSYAPLKGPKADIVQHILQNSALHPEIPQRDVQVLLWAILARTPITQMPRGYQLTAAKLLTPKELLALDRSVVEVLTPIVRQHALATLPASVRRVFEAENQLREKLTQTVEAPFEELERIAVLAGVAPTEAGGRVVQRGRWSYHPDGYFVRYFASSYTETKIQVYLPDQPFQLERDEAGNILRVVMESPQPHTNTGGTVMLASSRPVAASAGMTQAGGTSPGSSGPGTSGGLKEYEPSGNVAVPAGGGQRLGQSSGKPGAGQGSEEKKTKKAVEALKKYRDITGLFEHGWGQVLAIPSAVFDWLLDFQLAIGFKLVEDLRGDPPRADYKIIASVERLPFTPLKARAGLSPALAASLNALMEASTDMNAKLRAATISLDRQGGALQDKDKVWSDEQARAIIYYKAESGKSMLVLADRLEALVKTLRAEGVTARPVTAETARKYQARLRDNGFTPEELAAAKQAGMTGEEVAFLLKERIEATPQEMTGDIFESLTDSIDALRFFGKRLVTLPSVAPGKHLGLSTSRASLEGAHLPGQSG